MNIRVALFVLGFVSANIAHAANLVPNPDFDSGLDGWTQTGTGSATIDDSFGLPQPPSAHLVADSTLGIGLESSCMEVDDSVHSDFYMNAGGTAGYFGASIQTFSDTACSNMLDSIDTEAIRGGDLRIFGLYDFALPDGAKSAKILLIGSAISLGQLPDVHFDHIGFGPTGTVPSAINVAQQGLSGAWYNPETSGQGFEFIISQDSVFLTESAVFGAWYTYDTTAGGSDAQRWYSLQTSRLESGMPSVSVGIHENINGNFDSLPPTSAVTVGTGTIMFDTCSTGSFSYTFDDGRSGTVPLRRLMPNVTCVESGTPTDPPSDFGLSGSWYDTDTGGQGLLVSVDPVDAQVFVGWYTYALDGEGQGVSGQRWFTAQVPYTVGSASMDLVVYSSTGGTFDSNATAVTTVPVGTATLTYLDCHTATFDYDFTSGELSGQSGTITLTRLGMTLASCDLP
jgi:hypothetical protein